MKFPVSLLRLEDGTTFLLQGEMSDEFLSKINTIPYYIGNYYIGSYDNPELRISTIYLNGLSKDYEDQDYNIVSRILGDEQYYNLQQTIKHYAQHMGYEYEE